MSTISDLTPLDHLKASLRVEYSPLGAREKDLEKRLAGFVQNSRDFFNGNAASERFLFVPGISGSGKTYTLQHLFKQVEAFQPWTDNHGRVIRPMISAPTPKQAGTKDLLITVLEAMGLPSEGNERSLTKLVKEQIVAQKVKYIHLDEFQHAIRSGTPKQIDGVRDTLKNLVSIPSWPLHIILSGVPLLDKIRVGDGQIERRSHVVAFRPLECPADTKFIESALVKIIVTQCGLELDETLMKDDFADRLCRAKRGGWGSIIETVQNACFTAIENNRRKVTVKHFAYLYRMSTGCKPDDNIFTAPEAKYKKLKPQNALIDLEV
ncbi:ATP-binding protein [Neorhizobium sp. DAR64872/K0K18]|uniref:ATP-binding protein n=1 Tax=Neorhizobium sp. DAR64872/K0K18 TaxID=3421958 RepID=UPI003D2E8264